MQSYAELSCSGVIMQKHLKWIALLGVPFLLYAVLYHVTWEAIPTPKTLALRHDLQGVTQVRVFRYADCQYTTLPNAETARFLDALRIVSTRKSLLGHDLKAVFHLYRGSQQVGVLWYLSDNSFRWIQTSENSQTDNAALINALQMRRGTIHYIEPLLNAPPLATPSH